MMIKLKQALVIPLFFGILTVLALIGWGQSIYKFTGCDFEAPYKCEAVYGAGLIPPVGAVVGWISIKEK